MGAINNLTNLSKLKLFRTSSVRAAHLAALKGFNSLLLKSVIANIYSVCIYIPVPVIWFGCSLSPSKTAMLSHYNCRFRISKFNIDFCAPQMILDDPITPKLSSTTSLAISGYRLDLKGQNDGTLIKKQNMSEIPKILAFLGPNPVTLTEPLGIRNGRQQQTL